MSLFSRCNCCYTHNIYIREYDTHFKYVNGAQFNKDYDKILRHIGCDDESKKSLLLEKIREEICRRQNMEKQALERKEYILKFYKPLNITVYTLQEQFLDPNFICLINAAKSLRFERTLQFLDCISDEKQLYGFPVFTEDFCKQLLNEIISYQESDMPKERPNSMNHYGILLDELGFHDNFSQILRTNYLDPLAKLLFPDWRGQGLDSHKIFTVQYKMNEDLELHYHYDNSEVTLNVCLGKDFEGGDLYFGDMKDVPIAESSCFLVPHKVGYGILHRGGQLHGALPIARGERHNLVFWMRASTVRNRLCPMCNSKPAQLVPAIGYGDGFTVREECGLEKCNVT